MNSTGFYDLNNDRIDMIEAQGQHVAVAAEAVEIVFEELDKGVQTFQKCKVPNQN